MFNIIGIIATVLVVIYFIVMIAIELYGWCQEDYTVRYIRSDTWLTKIEELYLIPTISFKVSMDRKYLEITTYFLVWEFYIAYHIRNENES